MERSLAGRGPERHRAVQQRRGPDRADRGGGSESLRDHARIRRPAGVRRAPGEQIIVEALLWPESDVTDATAFNEEVLLSRQLFPLSSIGLLNLPGEERCYSMFGALSTTSSLASVLHEIETLAGNVIRATEVYAGYLKARA